MALSHIEKLASTRIPLLIEGETGTGKGLFARKLHELSGRRGPYVAVNCAAISPNLLESELFGHIKGAFTGATEARAGLFASAEDGTLFLDEIGELPLELQPKLLHVLESGTVRRVGSNREERINARVVAATNQDLNQAVQDGQFRPDLLYRLNTIHLNLPPLRDRMDDLEGLIRHFSERLSQDMDLPSAPYSPDGLDTLRNYPWPGNVRELRNYIERAMLLGFPLGEHLPAAQSAHATGPKVHGASLSLESREKQYILETLTLCGGNKSRTADMLGISRRTLDRKIKLWETTRLTA
jgi:DNA-binding NtrC family response regulator